MTPSPRDRLANRLLELSKGGNIDWLADCAVKAGITPRQMGNALSGLPVPTSAYLRVCTVIQLDPMPPSFGYERPEFPLPTDFDHGFFSLAVRLRRAMHKHNRGQAGEAMGMGTATVFALERGDVASIGVVLRACAYCRQHPFAFLRVPKPPVVMGVSRETLSKASQMHPIIPR